MQVEQETSPSRLQVSILRDNYSRLLSRFGRDIKPSFRQVLFAGGFEQYQHLIFQAEIPTVNPEGKVQAVLGARAPVDHDGVSIKVADKNFHLSYFSSENSLSDYDYNVLLELYASLVTHTKRGGPPRTPEPFDLSLLEKMDNH